MEDYFNKEKEVKEKTKIFYQVNKDKLQKIARVSWKSFRRRKKLKNEIMLAFEIKMSQTQIEKEKNNILKIITIKEKIC